MCLCEVLKFSYLLSFGMGMMFAMLYMLVRYASPTGPVFYVLCVQFAWFVRVLKSP